MLKLDLMVKRYIFLFLNARDKTKKMALVCKNWNEFVYCGFAWESIKIKNIFGKRDWS